MGEVQQQGQTVVASNDDLVRHAKMILDEYIKVSNVLAERGVYLNLGINNGGDGKVAPHLTSFATVAILVRPPEPKQQA